MPFVGGSVPQTYERIQHAGIELPPDTESYLTSEVRDLLMQMLSKYETSSSKKKKKKKKKKLTFVLVKIRDPNRRISLDEIKRHPWVASAFLYDP